MATKTQLNVFLGKSEMPIGKLAYFKDGAREFSQFAYSEEWLANESFFDVSPDLNQLTGYQLRKAPSQNDSCFFHALADTEPDAWGRRVIARAHAKARTKDASLGALTEVDYLIAVDDFSRIGALRLQNEQGQFLRIVPEGIRSTPALIDLEKILQASRAFELSQETTEDLQYLQGRGTSLGGMRPKCTVLDAGEVLSLGKFPSVGDERSVTRGEVLALRLARLAGIDSAESRIVMVHDQPVAVIQRFDRSPSQNRIPYMSGASLLQARRDDEHNYIEVIDMMRSKCKNFLEDAQQLWKRIVFNFLINNVDDHLQNIGFLYVGNNQWKLAPAFDLNPFPDKERESKTWLTEDTGPVTSLAQLLGQAERFQLSQTAAQNILEKVTQAVSQWKSVAASAEVGMTNSDIADFKAAFSV